MAGSPLLRSWLRAGRSAVLAGTLFSQAVIPLQAEGSAAAEKRRQYRLSLAVLDATQHDKTTRTTRLSEGCRVTATTTQDVTGLSIRAATARLRVAAGHARSKTRATATGTVVTARTYDAHGLCPPLPEPSRCEDNFTLHGEAVISARVRASKLKIEYTPFTPLDEDDGAGSGDTDRNECLVELRQSAYRGRLTLNPRSRRTVTLDSETNAAGSPRESATFSEDGAEVTRESVGAWRARISLRR